MSIARKTFAAEAVILLCLARIAITILPFEKSMQWFGTGALEDAENIPTELDPAQMRIALAVRYMIARGVRFLPFDIECLPQAMAGSLMLTRRALPVRLSLGVPKRGGMPAHAWLEAGNTPIAGMATSDAYAPIARFVGPRAKGRELISLHEGR